VGLQEHRRRRRVEPGLAVPRLDPARGQQLLGGGAAEVLVGEAQRQPGAARQGLAEGPGQRRRGALGAVLVFRQAHQQGLGTLLPRQPRQPVQRRLALVGQHCGGRGQDLHLVAEGDADPFGAVVEGHPAHGEVRAEEQE